MINRVPCNYIPHAKDADILSCRLKQITPGIQSRQLGKNVYVKKDPCHCFTFFWYAVVFFFPENMTQLDYHSYLRAC